MHYLPETITMVYSAYLQFKPQVGPVEAEKAQNVPEQASATDQLTNVADYSLSRLTDT